MSGPVSTGVTAVVPCFNEADNVEHAYREIVTELSEIDLEVLFVDDGSSDDTLEKVRALARTDPRVQYLSFTRNFGFEAAFSAGYRYASRPWVLHVDADVQFPVAEAHKLVAAAEAGQDAVFGVRETRHDPVVRRVGARFYHFVARRVLGIEIPPGATTFRLVRTELARTIVDLRLGTPYFLATVPRLTNRYSTVPVAHRARQRGGSKLNFRWLVGHAMGLFVGFSNRMATVAALLALFAAAVAGLGAVGAAVGLLRTDVVATVVLGVLLAVLGVLAVAVRYLVAVGAGQARPALFYVREATVPVDPADQLMAEPTTEEARS
ncbi:glycosyltransferase family 2 protein [Actinophytocola glycyrrhizae]|uniref:Glycosyltransferase family 2 protein n=1 Tax=Actinophytocola glycyrrhizae TaxID=2044873 RepID=A0ABV9RV52_9PSEU